MSGCPNPMAKAKWVLKSIEIVGVPARCLDEIAKSQHIKVGRKSLPEDRWFSGALLFRGEMRAILLNTVIDHPGRINFTFAHELGHYFLQHKPDYCNDGQIGFHCTAKEMEQAYRPQEVEANQFAAELLMPEEHFRPLMAGAVLDYTLINSLARWFCVSKHACCNRLLDFTRDAYIVVISKGSKVKEIRASLSAKRHVKELKKIPAETAAYDAIVTKKNQSGFTECNPIYWLGKVNPAICLYEWTRGDWKHGVAMTILRW